MEKTNSNWDQMKAEVIELIKRLKRFTTDELKSHLCEIKGPPELVLEVADDVLINHPMVTSVFEYFMWKD